VITAHPTFLPVCVSEFDPLTASFFGPVPRQMSFPLLLSEFFSPEQEASPLPPKLFFRLPGAHSLVGAFAFFFFPSLSPFFFVPPPSRGACLSVFFLFALVTGDGYVLPTQQPICPPALAIPLPRAALL